MVQIINRGGFRERANRSKKYQTSENKKTTLEPNRYLEHNIKPTSPLPERK